MGIVQLKKLDELNRRRIENSQYLLEKISNLPWIKIPIPKTDIKHTYFWCPVMVKPESGKTIGELKEHLNKNKIGFRQRYSEPIYRQPVLKTLGLDYSDVKLPNVEKTAGKVIGLPNHPGLTNSQRKRIIQVLETF